MNLNFFIAKRIGKRASGNGKLSKISNMIATVSVGISIAVMILAIAIANGFRSEIREKAAGFSGDATLSAPGVEIVQYQYPIKSLPFINKIDSLPFVKTVQPVAYRTGLLKTEAQIQGVLFKGVDTTYDMAFFARYLSAGILPDYSFKTDSTGYLLPPSNDILISKRLSDLLHYRVGDKVLAYFVEDDVTLRRFTVAGIFDAQLEELDKSLVIADLRHITRLNGWKNGEISGYEIVLNGNERGMTKHYNDLIERILYDNTTEDDSSVVLRTLQERFYVLFDWLHLLDLNVLIILVLMIAVAGFNMISGLLIILFERISQIGLLKALGMRNRDISRIFLYRSSFIVVKGLVAGNVVALVLCYIEWKYKLIALNPVNYFVTYVPVELDWSVIVMLNVAAFLLIMIILVIPCHFISKISPARTLVVR